MQFLASVEAGEEWRRREPRALILTLAEGFALGRAVNGLRLGPALAGAGGAAPGGSSR